jgi:hypothetical protein
MSDQKENRNSTSEEKERDAEGTLRGVMWLNELCVR